MKKNVLGELGRLVASNLGVDWMVLAFGVLTLFSSLVVKTGVDWVSKSTEKRPL